MLSEPRNKEIVCFLFVCFANCYNPAVSAGLCCTYVYLFYCLVICGSRIVILANCVTLYNIV